jgi:hypothetical protein
MTLFLSFHFGDSDRELVRQVEGFMGSQSIRVITGEELGGGALTPAIMERIAKSDGLVAVMTKRMEPGDNGGTHPWVVDEFKHAKSLNKRAIALVAPGVAVAGAYQDHERIDYNPQDPLKAFLKLSRTIGLWKFEAGRLLKVQLRPPEVADQIAAGNGNALCKYRLVTIDGVAGDWIPARTLSEGDGTYAYLTGVQDDSRIQLRVELAGNVWRSDVLQQWMTVELKHP